MYSLRDLKELVAEAGLRTADFAGQEARVLDYLISTDDLYMPVDGSFAESTPLDNPDGHVVFPAIQGLEGVGSEPYHMCVFAHAFRARGYEPILLQCSCDLSTCFQKPIEGRDYPYCARCEHTGHNLFEEFNLTTEPLSAHIGTIDVALDTVHDTDVYRGVPVTDLALASTRRTLLQRTVELDDSEHRQVYDGFLESAIRLTDAAYNIQDVYDIAATVAWDGAYVYGGTFMHAAATEDIPAYHCARGFTDGTLMFGRPTNVSSMPAFANREFISEFLERSLEDDERDKIDHVMDERTEGANDVPDPIADTSKSISQQDYDSVIGLFTNLMWDASLEGRNIVFDSPYDWIEATIDHVRSKPNTLLVVKAHPAEAVYGTNEPVAEWIEKHLSPLPDNLLVLEPETEISPYELLHDLDAGIVYNSTIGLEMAYRGVPVVVAGETHYRGFGFTDDPTSTDEYLARLNEVETLGMTPKQQERAQRYAYLFFVAEQLPFPELFPKTADRPISYPEVRDSETYSTVVSQILTEEPVHRPDRYHS